MLAFDTTQTMYYNRVRKGNSMRNAKVMSCLNRNLISVEGRFTFFPTHKEMMGDSIVGYYGFDITTGKKIYVDYKYCFAILYDRN